jgi:hypothetical protein
VIFRLSREDDPRFLTRLAWTALGIIALIVAGPGREARAQEKPKGVILESFHVGFDDRYKMGYWTQVEMTFVHDGPDFIGMVTLSVPDEEGAECTVMTSRPVTFQPGLRTEVRLYVKPGNENPTMNLAVFNSSGKRMYRREIRANYEPTPRRHQSAMSSSSELLLGVGPDAGLRDLTQKFFPKGVPNCEVAVAQLDDIAHLPTRWYGYDGINAVILSTSQAEIYRGLTSNSARFEALDQWVRMGGRLVVSIGSSADELLRDGGPLARFIEPARYEGLVPLRDLRALETFSESTSPIALGGEREGPRDASQRTIMVPRLANVTGIVEATHEDVPLVARIPHGFGEVVFLAVDLDQSPLRKWQDRELLLARLLHHESDVSDENSSQFGYETDLAENLRNGLENFRGVTVTPFWVLVVLVIGYIGLIGPVDYFLVRYVFKRMELTWFTFPLIVIVVSGAAYLGAYWLKGSQLRINQIDVVDVDTTTNQIRGTSWFTVFSPHMVSYDVALTPRLPDGSTPENPQRLISWLGAPRNSFNSMPSDGTGLWQSSYSASADWESLNGVPLQVWSSKGFASRWSDYSPLASAGVEAALTDDREGGLQGKLTWNGPETLQDAALVYDRRVYPLKQIKPGNSIEIDQSVSHVPLADYFRQMVRGISYTDNANLYLIQDTMSEDFDARSVLFPLMFYQASDSRAITGSTDRYQQFLDMSDQLQMGRAVLVGQVQSRGGQILLDEQAPDESEMRNWCWYRYVLPVSPP